MKKRQKTLQVGIATAIILGTIGWLAYSGYGSNKSYYVTIAELGTIGWLAMSGYDANKSYYVTIAELGGMGDKAYHSQLRVEGFVQPGSIEQNGTHVTFVLNEFESHSPKAAAGHLLKVNYNGTEPPPDTFKDDSQALAAGTFGRDGVFHANTLQAKCASKYAPAGPNQPGAAPAMQPAPGTKTAANAASPRPTS